MFAASSNRALSSITTVTSLPARAASTSASTTGESAPVRYSVCLIASTLRVCRRLAQEVDDRREAVERMVQQHVLLADRLEDVRAARRSRCGTRGCERRVLQVAAVDEIVDRHQAVEVDRPVDRVVVLRCELEALEQEVP